MLTASCPRASDGWQAVAPTRDDGHEGTRRAPGLLLADSDAPRAECGPPPTRMPGAAGIVRSQRGLRRAAGLPERKAIRAGKDNPIWLSSSAVRLPRLRVSAAPLAPRRPVEGLSIPPPAQARAVPDSLSWSGTASRCLPGAAPPRRVSGPQWGEAACRGTNSVPWKKTRPPGAARKGDTCG